MAGTSGNELRVPSKRLCNPSEKALPAEQKGLRTEIRGLRMEQKLRDPSSEVCQPSSELCKPSKKPDARRKKARLSRVNPHISGSLRSSGWIHLGVPTRLGSARVSRVSFGVSPKQAFSSGRSHA